MTEAVNDPETRALLDNLHRVRQTWASGPPEAMREALGKTLREELSGLSTDAREQRLVALREHLVDEARQRQERADRFQGEVQQLASERDRLSRENARLRTQLEGSGGTSATADDSLDRLRDSLRGMLEGQSVSRESAGLSPANQALLRFFSQLIRFAVDFEKGVLQLQKEIGVGPAGEMVTRAFQSFQEGLKELLRGCLDGKEGSLDDLKVVLKRNAGFLIHLNQAHERTTVKGARALLTELDPEPILEKTKGMLKLGRYEQAWKELTTRHRDLLNLPPSDLYEQYCFEEFQRQLTQLLEAAGK